MSGYPAVEGLIRDRHNVLDEYQDLSVEARNQIAKADSLPFAVCLLNLTGDINIGQALRAASLLGAERALVIGRRKFDARGTVGVQHYLTIERIEALEEGQEKVIDSKKVLDLIKERGYQPVGVETGGRPLSGGLWGEILPVGTKPCLIFGNEGAGIPEEMRRQIPLVSIPQRGVIRSFNVSTAASIVMWHLSEYLTQEESGGRV